jgi:hypothetical protein
VSAFHARVYGLVLSSNIPVDGLLPIAPQPADLDVVLEPRATTASRPPLHGEILHEGELDPESQTAVVTIRRTPSGSWTLDYLDGTHFEIAHDARSIRCTWELTSTPQDAATYLLGPVLAYVLRLRGTLALHASAVAIREKAVLIAGEPGAGKSTTATAFSRRGATVITDDVAALDDGRVQPGYARLRLWSDVVEAMWGGAEALPLLTPTWTKRYADVASSFADRAYDVRAICVLFDRAVAASLRRLHGHEAAIALLRHASMTHALDASMRERELSQVTRLAAEVPVFAATAPDDLHRVHELCAAIERSVADA